MCTETARLETTPGIQSYWQKPATVGIIDTVHCDKYGQNKHLKQ